MSDVLKRRLLAVFAITFAGSVLAYIAMGDIGENLVYFWNPKELVQKGDAAIGATVRLGGVVQTDTMNWDAESLDLKFKVGIQPDSTADVYSVVVHAKSAPPQMFREGIGVVVEGIFNGTTFNADRVLVKHSNEYRAPKDGEKPEQIYKTLLNE